MKPSPPGTSKVLKDYIVKNYKLPIITDNLLIYHII